MDFGQVMNLLFTVFNTRAEDKPALARAYHAALDDISPDELEQAANEYIKTGRFFPKPAELREIHERIRADLKSTIGFTPVMHKGYKPAGGFYTSEPAEWLAYAQELEAEGRIDAADYMRRRASAYDAVLQVDILEEAHAL